MNTLNEEQKEKLKTVLAENHVNKTNFNNKQIAELAQVTEPVASYYKNKWGFGKKKKQKATRAPRMSLKEAIAVCKSHDLIITKETKTIEIL